MAPSESRRTMKASAVVLIRVDRQKAGRDNGVRRHRPFSKEGYQELRLDEVLGKSVKGVGLTALLVCVCEGGIAALILLAWRG
jgi:hypothetical protein